MRQGSPPSLSGFYAGYDVSAIQGPTRPYTRANDRLPRAVSAERLGERLTEYGSPGAQPGLRLVARLEHEVSLGGEVVFVPRHRVVQPSLDLDERFARIEDAGLEDPP